MSKLVGHAFAVVFMGRHSKRLLPLKQEDKKRKLQLQIGI